MPVLLQMRQMTDQMAKVLLVDERESTSRTRARTRTGDERILMLSGSAVKVGTRESGEGRKRRSFARRSEVGSRVKAQ